ncbi:MAG TPA: nuclear transport factor 2 family protein [Candidatus Acidoferrales bacterium]|jgi:hypothetical protein|nr:nuclear transport factor 2 family protein [Candidatus Acidoferrales bacterium]
MKRFFLAILLAVSAVGSCKAQEMTGDKAEEVKKEIIKVEVAKATALRSTSSDKPYIVDFVKRVFDDDIVHMVPSGQLQTKTEILADWTSKERTVLYNNHYDFNVRVYGNGDAAVVTYLGWNFLDENGFKGGQSMTTDVLCRQSGEWHIVTHWVTNILAQSQL